MRTPDAPSALEVRQGAATPAPRTGPPTLGTDRPEHAGQPPGRPSAQVPPQAPPAGDHEQAEHSSHDRRAQRLEPPGDPRPAGELAPRNNPLRAGAFPEAIDLNVRGHAEKQAAAYGRPGTEPLLQAPDRPEAGPRPPLAQAPTDGSAGRQVDRPTSEATRHDVETTNPTGRPVAVDATAPARVSAHGAYQDAAATAPPARTATTDAPTVDHQALAQNIAARARNLPQTGTMELRFALEPADLGPVRVRIESRGSRLRIEISAASGAAVEALTPGLARMSSELHRAGFADPEVSLGLEARGDGGAPHTRQQGANAQGRPRDSSPSDRPPRPYERERPETQGGRPWNGRFDRTI